MGHSDREHLVRDSSIWQSYWHQSLQGVPDLTSCQQKGWSSKDSLSISATELMHHTDSLISYFSDPLALGGMQVIMTGQTGNQYSYLDLAVSQVSLNICRNIAPPPWVKEAQQADEIASSVKRGEYFKERFKKDALFSRIFVAAIKRISSGAFANIAYWFNRQKAELLHPLFARVKSGVKQLVEQAAVLAEAPASGMVALGSAFTRGLTRAWDWFCSLFSWNG